MCSNNIFTIAYIRYGDRTLMLKRSKQDDQAGKWNGLGGKVEFGESPQEAMIREVKEESGLLVKKYRMGGVVTIKTREKLSMAMLFIFEVSKFEGMIGDCSEGKLQWVKNSDLKNLDTNKGDHLIFDWLGKNQFFSGKIIRNIEGDLTDFAVDFF